MSYKADKKYEANKIEIFPGGRSLNQKTFHKDGMDIFWNMMRCTCTTLYHAIKIQPIGIQEKPSYIWWYYTQSSQHLLCVCHMDCVDRCIFYSMVLDSCVYEENTSSDKCDIPWCILYHKNVLHLFSLWKYLALCSFRCIFLPRLQMKKKFITCYNEQITTICGKQQVPNAL